MIDTYLQQFFDLRPGLLATESLLLVLKFQGAPKSEGPRFLQIISQLRRLRSLAATNEVQPDSCLTLLEQG